jgi:hypothetical protein
MIMFDEDADDKIDKTPLDTKSLLKLLITKAGDWTHLITNHTFACFFSIITNVFPSVLAFHFFSSVQKSTFIFLLK